MAAFVYRLAGEPDDVAPVESPFTDVGTGHGFYKEIAWMKATGLSSGWSDGKYRPYLVSREAMAAFMKRYAGAFCHLPGAADFVAPASPAFVDSPDSGFLKEIEWMRVAAVSKGWFDGTYRPFDYVTREAMPPSCSASTPTSPPAETAHLRKPWNFDAFKRPVSFNRNSPG